MMMSRNLQDTEQKNDDENWTSILAERISNRSAEISKINSDPHCGVALMRIYL